MNIRTAEEITAHLVETLKTHLTDDEKVTWLIPGGSGLDTAVAIMNELIDTGVSLEKLSITLTDERYGEPGHENENWKQLLDKGFTSGKAKTYRVLQQGLSLEETTGAFADTLQKLITDADFAIAMFGVGADGHVAGIKPGSPSTQSEKWACGYEWEDFTRITATPTAIQSLDEAAVYAVGAEKAPALHVLAHETKAIDEQPAQILKQIPACTLFTDYNGS